MTRRRLLTVIRVVIAVLTLAAVSYAVVRNWTDVSGHLDKISWETFLASALAAGTGTWLTMLGWKWILRDLGSDLHTAPASGVFYVGQMGKYIPGSLWAVLVQADMASSLGVPRRRTAVSSLLSLGFALLAGLLVGLPSAAYLLGSGAEGFPWWTLVAVPAVAILLMPALLNRLIRLLLRVLRREPLEHDLSARAILTAFATYVAVWLSFGVHTLLLARAVADVSPDLMTASLTGYALSVSLGMLLVVLPAGLGAREGLLTLILSAVMPTPAAAAVAITSRFIVTMVDVLAAALGWLYARARHLLDARAAAD